KNWSIAWLCKCRCHFNMQSTQWGVSCTCCACNDVMRGEIYGFQHRARRGRRWSRQQRSDAARVGMYLRNIRRCNLIQIGNFALPNLWHRKIHTATPLNEGRQLSLKFPADTLVPRIFVPRPDLSPVMNEPVVLYLD